MNISFKAALGLFRRNNKSGTETLALRVKSACGVNIFESGIQLPRDAAMLAAVETINARIGKNSAGSSCYITCTEHGHFVHDKAEQDRALTIFPQGSAALLPFLEKFVESGLDLRAYMAARPCHQPLKLAA